MPGVVVPDRRLGKEKAVTEIRNSCLSINITNKLKFPTYNQGIIPL